MCHPSTSRGATIRMALSNLRSQGPNQEAANGRAENPSHSTDCFTSGQGHHSDCGTTSTSTTATPSTTASTTTGPSSSAATTSSKTATDAEATTWRCRQQCQQQARAYSRSRRTHLGSCRTKQAGCRLAQVSQGCNPQGPSSLSGASHQASSTNEYGAGPTESSAMAHRDQRSAPMRPQIDPGKCKEAYSTDEGIGHRNDAERGLK